MKMNVAITYATKGKNPKTGIWDYATLVPAANEQRGDINFVVVCCEPSKNGIYKYGNSDDYDRWINGKKVCLYVPIEDCEYKSFDEIDWSKPFNKALRKEIIKCQTKWFKNEVKNRDYEYKNKPSWMLEEVA